MNFFQVWLRGYLHPLQVGEALRDKPAPHWGLAAQGLRMLMNALLLYLPLALLGRQPATPSALTFVPTEHYYTVAIFMAPLFILAQWLLLSAVVHVVLRLTGHPGGIDRILNITGLVALIIGTVLIIWDWLWIALDWHNDLVLGISHLAVDVWAVVITVAAFRTLLEIHVGLGIALNLLWLALGIPLAMIFMRAPV